MEFDLGANYDLTAAHIWNFNAAGFTGRGVKDVKILVSSSTSGVFTYLTDKVFTQATGAADLPAQVVPLIGATNVRRVRFEILTAWSGQLNEYVGLSEVRFQGSAPAITVAGTNLGPIPDSDPGGRDIHFNVNAAPGVAVKSVSVQFTLNPSHSISSDLKIILYSPDGASAWIYGDNYGGYTALAGPYTFNDSGAATLDQVASGYPNGTVVPSGSYKAGESLTPGSRSVSLDLTFGGKAANGIWKLQFIDQVAYGFPNTVGTVSDARLSITTNEVIVAGTNLGPIPDSDPAGREILFNVTGAPGVVKTVSTQFTFNPAHAWMSDLRIQLISPNGTSAWIYLPSAGLSSDLLGPYTIADTGTASLQTASTGLGDGATLASGTYRAANGATLVSLNLSFAGDSPNGIWKLRFADVVAPDTTSVSQASLTLTTASPGKPTIAYQTNGSKVFNLTAADSSASYLLQGSDNLSTWIPLQTFTTSGTGAASITDSTARGPRYFYRAVPVVTPGL